jgi:hypothetical protein
MGIINTPVKSSVKPKGDGKKPDGGGRKFGGESVPNGKSKDGGAVPEVIYDNSVMKYAKK